MEFTVFRPSVALRAFVPCWLSGLMLLNATPTGARVILVNASAPASPTPDGQSWATAFPKVQDALGVAGAGDEVWVAAGTYLATAG
ncbi:MAG: hypothetical protein DME26_06340, partial [Verrucomicrobia bacterium]